MTEFSPPIRKLFIRALSAAMAGDLTTALALIEREAVLQGAKGNKEAFVRTMSIKAELLFLDCRETEAIKVFSEQIEPYVSILNRETRLIIGHNRNVLGMSALELNSGKQFSDLYDRARLTREKLFDAEATVYAFESAAKGKHYDALPTFWREVLETYRQGNWKYFRRAASRLAGEFLALGWIDGAAYQAILALDQEMAKRVAGQALLSQNPQAIDLLITNVLKTANLKRHAMIGCLVLCEIADAIPDNRISDVFQWLILKASIQSPTLSERNLFNIAWDAMTNIADRLTAQEAITLVTNATEHETWLAPNHSRRHLIEAVYVAVSNLSLAELHTLAQRAVGLATTTKHDLDYANAINLLCGIAKRGGREIATTIGDVLYSNEQTYNALLMQVAEVFNKRLASEEDANLIAQRVAGEIRNQVQRGGTDTGDPGESFGRITIGSGNESVSVSLSSFVGVQAVLNHRKLLSKESVDLLVNAILDMIKEPENIPANKTALIDCLFTLADCLGPDAADSLFESLAPLAGGSIPEAKIIKATGDPNNPLNRFTMNVGNSASVQGGALRAVAYLDHLNNGKYAGRLDSIFMTVLTDTNPEIRMAAFGALRWVTELSEPLIMSLLLGTKDPDPNTAYAAYSALSRNKHLQIPESLWHQLIYSLTMTSKSPISILRRATAYTIKSLRDQCPKELSAGVKALEERLAQDICYSVRSPLIAGNDNYEVDWASEVT